MAGSEAAPFRVRRLGRGLARGRDRHRRLASRRALSPAGGPHRRDRRALEGLGALDSVVRSPRRARGVLELPRAVRRSSGCCGSLDRAGSGRAVRRSFRGSSGRVARTGRPRPCDRRRRGSAAWREAHARALRRATCPRAVRSGKSRCHAARAGLRARRARDRRRREASSIPRPSRRQRRRRRHRLWAGHQARPLPARRDVTTSRSACRRTTGTGPCRRSSSCVASSTPTTASTRSTHGCGRSGPAESREAHAQEIFDELEIEEGGPKRHPLESETFRALLEEPALLRAA